MDQFTELQEKRSKFDDTMARVRKCRHPNPEDLKTKYRKAYEALIADARAQANEVLMLMVYGGFQIAEVKVPGFKQRSDAFAETESCRTMLRSAGDAVKSGNAADFYKDMLFMRQIVRQIAIEQGAVENQLFGMYAEAIET